MGMISKIKSAILGVSEKASSIFKKIDLNAVSDLEECLLRADFGVRTTDALLEKVRSEKPQNINLFVKDYLSNEIKSGTSNLLRRRFELLPAVILVIGVNGNGKTTTVAKLANCYKKQNSSVRIVAADTFRAAATEQLHHWAEQIKCDFTAGRENSDPASVVYKGYQDALAADNDVLIVDTAGRLHTRDDLMKELLKVKTVLRKFNNNLPHETVLILDGITGQNAFSQIETFSREIGIDSVIVTKLDSTAKGGCIVGIIKDYKLPISAICFGEGVDDIKPFSPKEYLDSIFG